MAAIPESARLFMAGTVERARKLKKTIVFPEGSDARVLEAAARLAREGVVRPVLIGLKPASAPEGVAFADPPSSPLVAKYAAQEKDYEARGKKIQEEAELDDHSAETAEHRALRYDLGEGLLEIALVLSSLYFISRKQMFPVIGIVAGIAGAALAITGLLV